MYKKEYKKSIVEIIELDNEDILLSSDPIEDVYPYDGDETVE